MRKYYFTNRALNIWNSFPNHVVLSDTVNVFKFRLDKFWQSKILYMILELKFREPEVEVGIS